MEQPNNNNRIEKRKFNEWINSEHHTVPKPMK